MSHEEISLCPVCQMKDGEFEYSRITQSMTYNVFCPRCHNFVTSYEFLLFNQGVKKRHLLSGLIRELNEAGAELPKIFVKDMEELFSHPLMPKDTDIDAKKEKLLISLRRRSEHFGDPVEIDDKLDISTAYARDAHELLALVAAIRDGGLLAGQRTLYTLTEKGWKEAERLIAKQESQLNVEAAAPANASTSPGPFDEPSGPLEIPADQQDEEYAPDKTLCDLYESMQLHPEVVRVSWKAFKHGLFAEAIENAYKEINVAVKRKAGCSSKNDHSLMAKVFDEADPILRLNDLSDENQESEQLGFKLLFMGATTGIRNPKAHTNTIQKDPHKTLHYLAFASLLMKIIDQSVVVPQVIATDETEKKK